MVNLKPNGVYKHATVVVDDAIYIIGGATKINYIVDYTRVTRYRNDEWKTVSSLLHMRFAHFAILRDNCIYVYGGAGLYTVKNKRLNQGNKMVECSIYLFNLCKRLS